MYVCYLPLQYFHLREITIGGYDYASVDDQGNPTPIIMELTQYTVAELNTVNNSYVLDGRLTTKVSSTALELCVNLMSVQAHVLII